MCIGAPSPSFVSRPVTYQGTERQRANVALDLAR
jgi:hypothetical protein